MSKKVLLPLVIIFVTFLFINPMTDPTSYGIFDSASDIGTTKFPGISKVDAENDEYLLSGSGTNMWFHADEFYFVWKRLKNSFILYSCIDFIGGGIDPHRKAGLIIRQNLTPGSPYISAAYHGDGLVSMQYRTDQDSITHEIRASDDSLSVLQLEKKGNRVIMEACKPGMPLKEIGSISFETDEEEIYAGIFICSHNPEVVERAVFSNTRICIPGKADLIPYTDFLGSRIEILDIESGKRKVVYETSENLEAPNWSPDGKYLILNGRGKLYKFLFESKERILLNTDFAISNNNDHGFSPDGKYLAISHHAADRPQGDNSVVYIMPSEGGKPVQITQNSPSYWHGWSPDGKYLIYTAKRNKQWNIYRIPASGGDEEPLTNNAFLNDGSQYSANGEYIWFNSNRSGIMQIWKMKKDGSEQEQITDDSFQNWFPHESPDGKNVVFLSYLHDVDPWDHPYYKHVMIRCMNTDGSNTKVMAHLYGGQGTINVPSWSPDSKKIAFVSNTEPIPVE